MKITWKKALLILASILLLGGWLRIYKLDNMSLKADEYIGVNVSYGHQQTGEWKFWDWNTQELTDQDYTRGKVYYWQVSQILDFLPPTVFNFRLISVFWGIIGIISMFFVGYFYSRNLIIALLSAFLWAVSLSAITFDRHLRMYSMFAPIYLILSFFVYQLLENKLQKNKNFIEKFSQKTQLNWYYFIPTFLLLIVSFATHFLTINLFPVIGAYILILAIYFWKQKDRFINKYSLLLSIPLISFIILVLTGFLKRDSSFIGFMENNFSHFENITLDYSHNLIAITFFILGAVYLIKRNFKRGLWLVLSFLVPFLLAIFIWDRSAGAQYIYFIQTFQAIIIASGIYFLAKNLTKILTKKKWYLFFKKENYRKILIFSGILIYSFLILYNFNYFQQENNFYGDDKKWTHSNYQKVFDYFLKHRSENALLVTRDFRNYNYAKTNIPVFDFGGENKPENELTLEKLKNLETENQEIWIVIATNDHDYIESDARHYIRDNYQFVETNYTNDSMEIWKFVSKK
jgi:hypothetical protein